MKSERRHELQTNALADWIGETIEQIRPYQTTLLGVALLVMLLIGGATWWSRHSASQAAEAWGKLNTALESGNPAMLDDLAEHNRGTVIAGMAGALAGDIHLSMATQERFTNRAIANQELNKATDNYNMVLAAASSPLLKERATFGLARVLETQGSLDEAVAKYEEIEKTWPNGAYAGLATRRLEDLRNPATKKFYDDFRNYDPKPAYATEPGLPTKSSLSKPDSLKEPSEEPVFRDPRFNLGAETSDAKDKKPEPAQPSGKKPAPVAPAPKVK